MILLSTLGPKDDSADIIGFFGQLAVSAPIRPDFHIPGFWMDGEPITIAGERKKPNDLVRSMHDGSLVNKFKLGREEGYRFQFLVVEGLLRKGNEGLLETMVGRDWRPLLPEIQYRRFRSFLLQLHYFMDVLVIHTTGPKQSATEVLEIHSMFQQAPEDHTSLLQFYKPKDKPDDLGMFEEPSLCRRWAKELVGVGWKRSRAVEEAAEGDPMRLAEWDEKGWTQVPGIGKKMAKQIWEEIHGA